jgi:hypothetical protein
MMGTAHSFLLKYRMLGYGVNFLWSGVRGSVLRVMDFICPLWYVVTLNQSHCAAREVYRIPRSICVQDA